LKEARIWFEKAIEIDPKYALAYAGLADTNSWIYEWEGGDKADLEAAEKNCQKALSLAPALSESHSSLGFVLSLGKKYDEAEQEFEKATSLNPNNFDAYYYAARSNFARGRIPESADMFRKASEVRREDFQSKLLLGQCLRVLKKDANEIFAEGIELARRQLKIDPTDKRALSLAAGSLYDIGQKEEAFQWINKALDLYPEDTGVLVNAAGVFAKDHNVEKAIALLKKVFGKGFGKRDWIERDPDYDSIRNEPRFMEMVEKLK